MYVVMRVTKQGGWGLYLYNYSQEETRLSTHVCAMVFGVMVLLLCMGGLVGAFMSTGPLVLGTEMNTNGSVEYLCLGTDCERLWIS